ncbi:cation:H+ antiporter [Amycolatopsis arida]|uniref:Cation:H+ antiporter n=1 Tax=Amycolatopsis arida TaxID=587909 RepID=A0A1I6AW39_9PSEU|nr:sodium/calcium exchanger protein [Amycolatopsis arida]SFQ72941.1 cation:H+ antiporter [Amycolatopsis arida]
MQTLAIVAADVAHRRVNLEHAAASGQNLLFGCLLIVLLSTVLLGSFSPEATVLGVDSVSVVLVGLYLGGLRLIRAQRKPMWRAVATRETRPDVPTDLDAFESRPAASLWLEFAVIAALVVVGGWAVARAAESLVVAIGLNAGSVGGVLMGLVNALPETVAAIATVRRGALTLAVAAVIGGNCLDALNLIVGGVAFRGGSLFHTAGTDQLFLTTAALLMTTVLLGGLLVRQLAERMLRLGYVKIDGQGLFGRDRYAAADRVDRVDGDTVVLTDGHSAASS